MTGTVRAWLWILRHPVKAAAIRRYCLGNDGLTDTERAELSAAYLAGPGPKTLDCLNCGALLPGEHLAWCEFPDWAGG